MLGRKEKMGRPEDDRDFARLSKERDKAAGVYDESCRRIAKDRNRLHALEGASAFAMDDSGGIRAEAVDAAERIRRAEAERDEAREKMRALDDEIRAARIKAAKKLAEQYRPAHDANSKIGLLAKLNRHADEIAAASENKATRDALQARRAMRGVVSLPVNLADEALAVQLKESTEAALENGIVRKADIPQQLRNLWWL